MKPENGNAMRKIKIFVLDFEFADNPLSVR